MSREELVGTRRSRVGRHVVRGFQPGKLLALRGADDPKKPPRIKIRDLARVTGIGMTTIRNWETGVSVPQVDKLLKVATKLGVKPPMDELIVVPRDERFPADWRALYGLLQPDLGRIVGIETSVISLIETGTRIPTLSKLPPSQQSSRSRSTNSWRVSSECTRFRSTWTTEHSAPSEACGSIDSECLISAAFPSSMDSPPTGTT